MNVKIALTVPFEEVPEYIEKIIKDSAEKAALIDNILRYSVSCKDVGYALSEIDDVRKRIASLDFLLEDCYNILSSYQQRLSGGAEQHAKEDNAETSEQG